MSSSRSATTIAIPVAHSASRRLPTGFTTPVGGFRPAAQLRPRDVVAAAAGEISWMRTGWASVVCALLAIAATRSVLATRAHAQSRGEPSSGAVPALESGQAPLLVCN